MQRSFAPQWCLFWREVGGDLVGFWTLAAVWYAGGVWGVGGEPWVASECCRVKVTSVGSERPRCPAVIVDSSASLAADWSIFRAKAEMMEEG